MTDEVIIKKLKEANNAAAEALVDKFGRLVYSRSWNMLRNHSDAEDITQEVFIRAFKYAKSFNGTSIKGWLARITYNCCIDLINKNKRVGQTTKEFKHAMDIRQCEEQKNGSGFYDLIAHLKEKEQEILTYRYLFGMNYQEISDLTGKSSGGLRNIVSQALKNLRKGE